MADLKKLKDDIKAGTPSSLYVFYGEESYLKAYYLKQLEKACESPFPEFDMIRLDGAAITPDSFSDAVDSFPMGGGRKMVEIVDYPLFSKNGVLNDAVTELLRSVPDYLCLVFVYDVLDYKTDNKELFKAFSAQADIINFEKASLPELVSWLSRRFASLGKEISRFDAEKMVFFCGDLMTNLITEVEKIAAGTEGKVVTYADIERLASRSIEARTYYLTNRLSEGDVGGALSVLHDLIDTKTEPIRIAATVSSHFRQLYGAKLASEKGLSTNEIKDLLGLRSEYPAKIAVKTAGRMSLSKLRLAQSLCLEATNSLKGSNTDEVRTLELLLLRLAS
ncbi:MAG: DNA polymerase III subunit delta [Clostridia bacterium]|nr:DNA polymerase III subunit delta [Clostridia bacterium]